MRVLVIKRGALRLVDQELQSANEPTTQNLEPAQQAMQSAWNTRYLPLFVAANLVTPGGATSLRPAYAASSDASRFKNALHSLSVLLAASAISSRRLSPCTESVSRRVSRSSCSAG